MIWPILAKGELDPSYGGTMITHAAQLFRLDGKIALVTGGAGIYGRHIVRALAEAGAHVIVASRDDRRCRLYASELTEEGLSVSGESVDLASGEAIECLRDRVLSTYGRLDVLFNNAVARAGNELRRTTRDDWESAMRVNATGLFLTCKAFSASMCERRSGSIVNVSSIYGIVGPTFSIYEGTPFTSPVDYAFAKGGMINFTRYLASYLAPFTVRANCLSPGGIQTDDMPDKFVRNYCRRTPLRRMACADDIKGPSVFLASDASRYITGQNLVVDGGWTAI